MVVGGGESFRVSSLRGQLTNMGILELATRAMTAAEAGFCFV